MQNTCFIIQPTVQAPSFPHSSIINAVEDFAELIDVHTSGGFGRPYRTGGDVFLASRYDIGYAIMSRIYPGLENTTQFLEVIPAQLF